MYSGSEGVEKFGNTFFPRVGHFDLGTIQALISIWSKA